MADRKRKIAVLGGGVAGLTAAFELSDPRHNGRYEVTVFQLGWRLGGKCASGRDMTPGNGLRIKEHGPHVFFGFYDNAFRVLRAAYGERPFDPNAAFDTFDDALAPKRSLVTMERTASGWKPWVLTAPIMPGSPGDPPRSLMDAQNQVVRWIVGQVRWLFPRLLPLARTLLGSAALGSVSLAAHALTIALHLAWPGGRARHTAMLIDFALATIRGAIDDGFVEIGPRGPRIVEQNVRRANRLEFRAWLKQHGAHADTLNSASIRALYDTVFAYPDGDNTRPGEIEAGTSFLVQMAILRYRGHIAYKMRAGTGDIVVAPMYEAMRARGVRFEFFHRVDRLVPSADGTTIDRIEIGRQATIRNDRLYDPLIAVQRDGRGLSAWPDRPLYEQLDQGEALRDCAANIESFWTTWNDPVPPLILDRLNGDFDDIVLAIPAEALKSITADFTNLRWRAMLDHSRTVQTINVQYWFNKSTADAGWTADPAPVVTGFDGPALDTWLDASETLPWETWTEPAQMAIICSSAASVGPVPPKSDTDYPARLAVEARRLSAVQRAESRPLWPMFYSDNGFDETVLHSEYASIAINPSDRYVRTPVDSSRHRLAPDESGFANMVLCGDWVEFGYNMGFFEGTVITGLMAANAITGDPVSIIHPAFEK